MYIAASSLLLMVFCYYSGILPNNKLSILLLLTINLINLLINLLDREKEVFLKRNYLKHSYIISLGFLIVFFQIPIEYIFGNIDLNNRFYIPSPDFFIKTVLIHSIAFISFILGYINLKKLKYPLQNKKLKFRKSSFLYLGSVVSFIVYILVIDKNYFNGSYGEIKLSPMMIYTQELYTSISYAYLIQRSINLRLNKSAFNFRDFIKGLNPVFFTVFIIFNFLILISGDRDPLITSVMIFLACFIFSVKIKLKLKVILPLLIISIFSIMYLGIVRQIDTSVSFKESVEFVKERNLESTYVSIGTIELAGSFRTTNLVVDYIPKYHDHFYGRFFLKNTFSIIPGLSQVLINIFFKNDPDYLNTSANYITYLNQGSNPKYGDGTSSPADIYLDFGVIGIVIIFLIFGAVVRRFEITLFKDTNNISLFFLIVSICYFAGAIRLGRISLIEPFNLAVRVAIFTYLNRIFITKKSNTQEEELTIV